MGTEKRLALWVVPTPEAVAPLAALGVDPLDPAFTVEHLATLLKETSATVKTALTTQSLIAGVGNAYSDEALHRAGLSPYKKTSSLDAAEVTDCTARWSAFCPRRSSGCGGGCVRAQGGQEEAMQVHGRTGENCPVCGDTIRQVSFATKSLQYCPTCQTGGKPLADRRLSRILK